MTDNEKIVYLMLCGWTCRDIFADGYYYWIAPNHGAVYATMNEAYNHSIGIIADNR